MSVSDQARNFCLFFIIGIFIGFIFDIFRGFRKSFKISNILVDIQDIFFLIISGALFFRSVVVFNDGNLRFYVVFSSVLGISIYFLTLSESCVIIIAVVFKIIRQILREIFKMLKVPFHFAKKFKFKKLKKGKIKEG